MLLLTEPLTVAVTPDLRAPLGGTQVRLTPFPNSACPCFSAFGSPYIDNCFVLFTFSFIYSTRIYGGPEISQGRNRNKPYLVLIVMDLTFL